MMVPSVERHRQVVIVKAGIVRRDRVLILRPTVPDCRTNFDLPGGRVEHGENLVAALEREVAEETGLNIEVVAPVKTWDFNLDQSTQFVGITYLCRSDTDTVRLSAEHKGFAWIDEPSIPLTWLERPELLLLLRSTSIEFSPVAGSSTSCVISPVSPRPDSKASEIAWQAPSE